MLLMQHPSGRIKPTWVGRQRFALLPRYERGGWRIREPFCKRNCFRAAAIVALCHHCHRRMTFLPPEPKCRRFPWRCWRNSGCENSAISVGVHDTRCYRSGFQSSSSDRQRERNSRSPFAAPLYFSIRQVSKTAKQVWIFSHYDNVLVCWWGVSCLVSLLFGCMTIWRTFLKGKRLVAYRGSRSSSPSDITTSRLESSR